MSALILFACIGFLLAIMWTDLVFDSQVLLHRGKEALPEAVLSSTVNYYRRVTYKPYMLYVVMVAMLAVIILQIAQGFVSVWVGWISLILFLISAGYAALFVIPTASRLALQTDSIEKQSELARSLFAAHVLCFILIVLLGVIQFYSIAATLPFI